MKHLVKLKNDNELILGLTTDITTVVVDGIQVYPVEVIDPESPIEPEPPVEDKTPPTYELEEELQNG